MGVLSDVLQYKARKEAEQAQAANAIPQAVAAFIQGRQQQQKNMIDMLQIDATLASKGLKRTASGGFEKAPEYLSGYEQLLEQGKAYEARNNILAGGGADPFPQLGRQGGVSAPTGGGMVTPNGQLNVPQVGTTPVSQQVQSGLATPQDQDWFATQATLNVANQPTSTTIKSEEGMRRELQAKAEESANAALYKAKGEQAKDLLKNDANFSKVVNLMSNLVSQKKGQLEETGGGGVIGGTIGKAASGLRTGGFSQSSAYPGQVTETTLAMNSILTGQNRVIEGVTRMISKTLPDEYDTGDYTADKVAQSLKNSYRLSKSIRDARLTPEFFANMSADDAEKFNLPLAKLTPQEEKAVDQLVSEVLATPRAKKYKLPKETSGSSDLDKLAQSKGVTLRYE